MSSHHTCTQLPPYLYTESGDWKSKNLLIDTLRDVIDAENDIADGISGASDTVVRSRVPRFVGASIPMFYLAMNSISSFIKYSTVDDPHDPC